MNKAEEGEGSLNKKTLKAKLHTFLEQVANELAETKEAGMIIYKHHISKEKLTKEEKIFIKTQTMDVLKAVGIVVPFALLPEIAVIIPILVSVARKKGIEILPSSFNMPVVTKPEENRLNNQNQA